MNLKYLFFRQTINNISRLNRRSLYPYLCIYKNSSSLTTCISPSLHSPNNLDSIPAQSPKCTKCVRFLNRYIHSNIRLNLSDSCDDPEHDTEESEDAIMNEFLSRFVWIMHRKLSEVYPGSDKKTIDGMLLIIVGKVVSEMEKGGLDQVTGAEVATPLHDLSEDLWKTVWEVSNEVLDDMQKAKKKEKLKKFIQSEEVKEMSRFAGEIGIRGEMLRELRFKWAREKMEESEFYESLELLRKEEAQVQKEEDETVNERPTIKSKEALEINFVMDGEKPEVISLPKRHGKIKYKIYGLDLSDHKWAEVADKIHESGEVLWPEEPKPISGKCKLVTERILSLKEDEDPSPLLAEWIELLQPNRIDWITLLDRLKERNDRLYLKVAEFVLEEKSFQTTARDYSRLIEVHAKEHRLEDTERILKNMNERGILPDILTYSALVHMYSKAGNHERAKEAFENLRSQGLQPDMRLYYSMIMAYVNAAQPKLGESLMREMEARDMKPTKEMYMALLRSFAQRGDVGGAQRISTMMQFAGFEPDLEHCTLLVEACGQAGDPEQARNNFDYMMKLGHKPDDRSTASMISAYEKKNSLDKALALLLELEKNGFEPGVATYSALLDWLSKLQLLDEAEQLLGKIAEQGEAPPFKVHISLCDMYSRAGAEKKALQALGFVEAKKDQLKPEEFEKVINGLLAGGFIQDARRMHGLMEAQGFAASEPLKVALMASQVGSHRSPKKR
ncbi:hypothetical protein NMG60_11024357 [Bertholletia excelsa]